MTISNKQLLPDYELLDCGDGRRLERFAQIIVDRPAPQAVWPKSKNCLDWPRAHAYYERPATGKGGWRTGSFFPNPWRLPIDEIILELRPAANNQVGVFPEQLPNWRWLKKRLSEGKGPLRVLNGFAYTGAATLAASSAGPHVEVCHVDGAKTAVAWARRNAALSGLAERPIRWIVDDLLKFMGREIKRGQRYDAFILDPPAFGRGPGGAWQLERDLPRLLDCVAQLVSSSPSFIILSCHAPNLRANDLLKMLQAIRPFQDRTGEALELTIPAANGNALPSSICGRI
ncbi:MAG: class I SAM-dependent methyltransferase [Desulfobulbaceae bacterium]|nr:class I SAM-dependent methyltransferase [Desulfobulbaceae bacterium]HIJ78295.1 SAM-dependent methyltransferase [Deltaproteobacteria bacterium]